MLERILSLIPHKPDGKFVHGAVKDFATGLGLKSGNIVSDWIADRSRSYEGYIYQIAAKYNVSVEWLKGETDIKEKPVPTDGDGLTDQQIEAIQFIKTLSDDQLARFIKMGEAAFGSNENQEG